jgi:hypothetical protein
VKERMSRTGHFDLIGPDNVFVAEPILGASSEAAVAAGIAWLDAHRSVPAPAGETNN